MIQHNSHIESGHESRLVLHPALSTLLFIGLFIVGQLAAIPFQLAIGLPMAYLPEPFGEVLQITVIDLILPFAITALVFMAFTKFVEKRPVKTLGFVKRPFTRLYFKGFGIGMALMILYWIIALTTGTILWSEVQFNFQNTIVWFSLLIVLPGWLIQGASEEILTRGWLYQSASLKYGGLWGLIIAPGLFGVLHLLNNNISLLSEVNLILFGVFAVFYVLKEGSLWGICALHSAWNWTQGNVLGIEVSGNAIIGGSLIKTGPMHGASYMTGAGFGAEGSLIVTVILLAGIFWLYFSARRKVTL